MPGKHLRGIITTAKVPGASSDPILALRLNISLLTHGAFAAEGFDISISIEDLVAQVLRLPPKERAELVERLIASFESRSAAYQVSDLRPVTDVEREKPHRSAGCLSRALQTQPLTD